MIVDTDVLIWYSRNNEKAKELLHSLRGFPISVITYMEIIQGVRNKQELNHFKKSLSILNITLILRTVEKDQFLLLPAKHAK